VINRKAVKKALSQEVEELGNVFEQYAPYVHGNLQDTPDNSCTFNLGKCHLRKQKDRIVNGVRKRHDMHSV